MADNKLYESKIDFCTKELSAKEKVSLKKGVNSLKLDECVKEGDVLTIDVDYAAKLDIHNEKNEKGEKNYSTYIIVDTDGQKYSTSSNSFWDSFMDIFNEMSESDEEWQLEVLKKPSKNYAGKYFLTCDIR